MARRSGRLSRSRGLPLVPLLRALPAARPRRRSARRAASSASTPVASPAPGSAKQPARRAATGSKPVPSRRSAGRWLTSSYSGPGGARPYDVYLPAGHRRTSRRPLLLLLHGCNQTSRDFVAATRFTSLADRHGFLIVAPRQSRMHQPGGCWRWYETAHQQRGAGEPALLAGITTSVLAEPSRWRIDPDRVYVAGISAGAAMALILAATYPDVFAAVGVHSGPAYRSASSGGAALGAMHGRGQLPPPALGAHIPPLIVFQGAADSVVHARSGEQIVEQWLAHEAARRSSGRDPQRITRSRTTEHHAADGRRYIITRWYTARGRKQLEYWRIDGLAHAWSGGVRDGSYSDPRGPRASSAMWRFLSAHSR